MWVVEDAGAFDINESGVVRALVGYLRCISDSLYFILAFPNLVILSKAQTNTDRAWERHGHLQGHEVSDMPCSIDIPFSADMVEP